MSEFDLIATYFAPLAGTGAFGLTDDAALLSGGVVTKDLLVEGIHFRAEDPLDLVARKALRVNVSDLVAKGCAPRDYLLGLTWRHDATEEDFATFTSGLAVDQKAYGLSLLGGDTTKGARGAPMVISITMIGEAGERGPVLRSGATPGDVLLVTGAIGNACLGLLSLHGEIAIGPEMIRAYQCPMPPFALMPAIARYSTAALDISDGLLSDAGHLAKASGVAVHIAADKVPLSAEGRNFAMNTDNLVKLLSWGDDYQALLAVAPQNVTAINRAAREAGIALTVIGEVRAGAGVQAMRADGVALASSRSGYRHF